MSIENQISKAIANYKRGKIFFIENFREIGSETAIRQALNRMEKKGFLIRLAHGIYLYPKKHPLLGHLQPAIEEIALAIARRDKARIIPTGSQALNKLGLSTQVPLNAVYLTDGSPRTLKIGKRTIKFKIASPKLLSAKNELTVLVILALRELGKENLTPEVLKKIYEALKMADTESVRHDMKLAPAWIAEIMKRSLN